MAYESHIRIVNGLPLYGEAGGITYRGFIRDTSGDPEWSAALEEAGMEAQQWTVGSFAGRDLDLFFWAGTVADSGLLIDAVSPLRKVWTLRAYMEFGGGTEALVEVDVVTLGIREFHGQIQARVKQLDAIWRAVTPETTINITTQDVVDTSWSTGVAYTVPGSATAGAIITLDPTTPASGSAPNRYQWTIKNNLARAVVKRSFLVHLGDTSGWSGTTAANTFLFCDGLEVPREIIGAGETRTYIEFVIDRIAPGQTKTFDLLTAGTVAAIPTTAGALTGRYRAPVPDFGWEVLVSTATSGTTITKAAAGWEVDRWKGAVVWGLTGAGAGQAAIVTSNTATVLTTGGGITASASGSRFLLLQSWLNVPKTALILNYAVRHTEHSDAPHGILYQDSAQDQPGDVRDDAADSWHVVRSFDNADDVACPLVSPILIGADNDWFTTPNISRTWQNGLKGTSVKSRNNGDGFTYTSPFPILEFRTDPRLKNPNGVGRFIIGSRQAQAEDWTIVREDAAAYSVVTQLSDVNHTLASDTRHVLFALWPGVGDEIPTSWAGDEGSRSGGGDTTMSDDSKEWVPDQWIGGTWRVTEGKGQGAQRPITDSDENTVYWSTALGGATKIPNDSSKYSIRMKPLIANLKAGSVWTLVLDVTGLAVSAISSLGAAERVAIKVRAGGGATGTTAHQWLGIGTGSRKLWVASGQTVVIDTEAKTAYVMSGATVIKDVTDWVTSWEFTADGSTLETLEWLGLRPGSSLLYTNRTAGVARHTVAMVMKAGWLW